MTLQEYVRKHGGQQEAARALGVGYFTLNRWLNHRHQPSEMARRILKRRGITWS